MAGIYEGISGVARKVKNGYVGVSSVARKLKSGFIGVGGVARQFYQNSLILYDNGVTNYTWGGNVTDTGSVLRPSGKFYISESVDISSYSKLGVTFIDSSYAAGDNAAYPNANLRLYNYNYSSSVDLFDTGYTRNPRTEITKLFDLDVDTGNDGNIEDHDLTNFRPAFYFLLWSSDWLSKTQTFNGTVKKIWFE